MTSARDYTLMLPHECCARELDIAALVEGYGAVLFRVAYSMMHSRAEAEDVVQDVFVRVLERRGGLPEVRDMRVWLVRIAWNLALDRRRRVRPEQMDEELAAGLVGSDLAADEAVAQAQRVQRMLKAIDKLPKDERQALLLSGVEDLTNAEVAAVMGKTESATRALLFRARTRLRERTSERGGKR